MGCPLTGSLKPHGCLEHLIRDTKGYRYTGIFPTWRTSHASIWDLPGPLSPVPLNGTVNLFLPLGGGRGVQEAQPEGRLGLQ